MAVHPRRWRGSGSSAPAIQSFLFAGRVPERCIRNYCSLTPVQWRPLHQGLVYGCVVCTGCVQQHHTAKHRRAALAAQWQSLVAVLAFIAGRTVNRVTGVYYFSRRTSTPSTPRSRANPSEPGDFRCRTTPLVFFNTTSPLPSLAKVAPASASPYTPGKSAMSFRS